MQNGLTLDHAVINVRSGITAAAEAYRRLGFHLTERGYHTLGTCNHLAILENNYIELLGYEPQATLRTDFVTGQIGLVALAFACDDATTLHSALAAQGLQVDPPQAFSRPVRISDGETDARFEIVEIPRRRQPLRTALFLPAYDTGVGVAPRMAGPCQWRTQCHSHRGVE